MTLAYIGLGSNQQDPEQQLKQALRALALLPKTILTQVSSFYLSEPIDETNQPDFINAVVALHTDLPPDLLLGELHKIEHQQGRVRTHRWGQRTLDLDILLYGDTILNTQSLIIPHKELCNRRFVLEPLAELDAELKIPSKGSIDTLLCACQSAPIKKIA